MKSSNCSINGRILLITKNDYSIFYISNNAAVDAWKKFVAEKSLTYCDEITEELASEFLASLRKRFGVGPKAFENFKDLLTQESIQAKIADWSKWAVKGEEAEKDRLTRLRLQIKKAFSKDDAEFILQYLPDNADATPPAPDSHT